jgi:peptidoglycan/xylan/chitin deacetylase (PgdA/CDA1 family)
MTEVAVVFTLDYELFGDGSGSVLREQIIPTAHLLNILDLYGAKLTIFFEYGQFAAYAASNDEKARSLNTAIELQLQDAVRRGHDVQLHLHPVWFSWKMGEAGLPVPCASEFDLTKLDEHQIEHWLLSGKRYLEELLQKVRQDYECIAFRAGAWSLQRSQKVVPILRELGFKCDSTVAPGAHLQSSYGEFDYRNVPSDVPWWLFSEQITQPNPSGDLVEIPILTRRSILSLRYYANAKAVVSRKLIKRFYPDQDHRCKSVTDRENSKGISQGILHGRL